MLGLLEKARQLRDSLGLASEGREEFAFDPDSGISQQEQKEIRREIEQVATGSRIQVSPEVFAVKAAKRGVLFPILVNVLAFVVLAAGLALFYFLFQRGETQAARGDTATITAEGKLIEEVKKESDAKLQEKNQQINQIQGQLADLDKQKQDLQTNMDAKVQEKESQLRASMSAELDAEKAALQKQGFSDADIQKKLADLEAQKTADFNKQLDTFKTQADADRKKSEATLANLQTQFNADLAKANADRQQVLSDSRQREADLQTQLAQKTKELASTQAQTQQQLTALSTQKQQEDLAAQQLVGLYSVAQNDIAAKNYPKAIASLQSISSYVNSSDVAVLPGIAKRRAVDLFIVDSLTTLVQGEIDKGKVDTASLVDAANKISDVRARVTDADASLRAGKLADAERLYGQALAVIPEISKSYAYFTGKAQDVETTRQNALHAALARAEAAFAAGRNADALSAYRDALAYLPETAARVSSILSSVGSASIAIATQSAQADQTQAAAPVLTRGAALLAQGQYPDAVGQYLTILQSYPQSQQALSAVKGATDAIAGLNARASGDVKAQADQVSALKAQLGGVQSRLDSGLSEILSIKKNLVTFLGLKQDPAAADSATLLKTLEQRYGDLANGSSAQADLQRSFDAASKKNADLTAQVTRLSSDNAKLTADLSSSRQETEKQRALAEQAASDLKNARAGATASTATSSQGAQTESALTAADQKKLADFDALATAYLAYAKQEDENLAKNTQQKGLMLSVGSRDSFLASLSKSFEGLLGRVQRYEAQIATDGVTTGSGAGRKSALDDVMTLLTGLANQKTTDAQKQFLAARLAAEKDPKMKSLLGSLQSLVTNR